jgi:hypothetical protein
VFSLWLVVSALSHAQTLTGSIEAIDHPSYAGIASQFLVNDTQVDGTSVYNGQMVLFCVDLAGRSIDEEVSRYPLELSSVNSPLVMRDLESFDVWDRYATPQDEGLAIAQLHWLVDNFYESHFLGSEADEETQYAFQNVVWEIFADGGTADGLSFTSGNVDRHKFASYGSSSAPRLWSEMNRMLDAVDSSGVTAGYVPVFEVMAIHDERGGYQDYLGLATDAGLMVTAVPEPGMAMLLGASGLLVLLRRRRG